MTSEDLVRVLHIDGEGSGCSIKSFPIQVALLRGTTADPNGNVTAEREALDLDNLAMAMAVKNSGGIVIVQVERVARSGSLNPRQVLIPRVRWSCVVVSPLICIGRPTQPRIAPRSAAKLASAPHAAAPRWVILDQRKIIARRCALELRAGAIVNLGIGMPEGVAAVAAEDRT